MSPSTVLHPHALITTVVSRPFSENTFVAWLPDRDDCLVFDPGFEPEKTWLAIQESGRTPAAILNTHGHSDHIAGNGDLKERLPDCPLMIGINEADKLTDPWRNLSAMFGGSLVSPPADRLLREGETLSLAGFELEIAEIPGHSSGHIVFIWRQGTPGIVFGGDVLFREGIGRTDFPDGSFEQLAAGIHEKLFVLPDDFVVLSGHGESTTIGHERLQNPFVGQRAMRQASPRHRGV